MISWYIDKRQYIQAATMMREFVVSLVVIWFGKQDLINREIRENAEEAINQLVRNRRPDNSLLGKSAFASDLISLWSKLSNLRNDIAHCGMREDRKPTEKLIKDVKSVKTEVHKLAEKMLNHRQLAANS